jgi:hypothetical protein
MQCWIQKEGSRKLRNQPAKGTRLDESVNDIRQAWECKAKRDECESILIDSHCMVQKDASGSLRPHC